LKLDDGAGGLSEKRLVQKKEKKNGIEKMRGGGRREKYWSSRLGAKANQKEARPGGEGKNHHQNK